MVEKAGMNHTMVIKLGLQNTQASLGKFCIIAAASIGFFLFFFSFSKQNSIFYTISSKLYISNKMEHGRYTGGVMDIQTHGEASIK